VGIPSRPIRRRLNLISPADYTFNCYASIRVDRKVRPAHNLRGRIERNTADALVARIRAHEGQFEWKEVGGPSDVSATSTRPRAVQIAIGVVVLAVLVWAVRRARRRPPAAG